MSVAVLLFFLSRWTSTKCLFRFSTSNGANSIWIIVNFCTDNQRTRSKATIGLCLCVCEFKCLTSHMSTNVLSLQSHHKFWIVTEITHCVTIRLQSDNCFVRSFFFGCCCCCFIFFYRFFLLLMWPWMYVELKLRQTTISVICANF